ncbi:MAG: hypothetical protein JST47_04940 [Bacteroidetes bacterium]|nr:hypothetical protein [Bacteroidota bacterium]MBS1974289.1 hypothetical protein [Bacteroidota bacterium]
MKSFVFLSVALCFFYSAFCQNEFDEFNIERLNATKHAMLVLGSWGAVNVVEGTIGIATTNGEAKYFHQMNLIWGATNFLIAAPSYFGMKRSASGLSPAETVKQQSTIEKIYLFNAGLDLVYITAGAYCIQKGNNDSRHDLYTGYGKSLILQGAGLLLFDASMSLIHAHHGKKLYKILSSLQFSGNSVGMIWKW